MYEIRTLLARYNLSILIERKRDFEILKDLVVQIENKKMRPHETGTIKIYVGNKKMLSQIKTDARNSLGIDTSPLTNLSDKRKKKVLLSKLRMSAYLLLEKHNYMVMHASAINLGNGALIFSGPSNAGKSTIITLIEGKIFHDNEVIIKKEGTSFYAFSPPFASIKKLVKYEYSEVAVKRIYILKKSKVNKIKSVDRKFAFKQLFLNDYLYFCTGCTAPKLLLNYTKLVKAVPTELLYFRKDKKLRRCIYEDIRN